MPLVKPNIGQANWGAVLNTALDHLDTNSLKPSARNPLIATSADIDLALSDAGTMIVVTAGVDGQSQQFRVPANAVVPFPVGTVITFITIDSYVWITELYDETSDTRSNIYGEGQGTNTNWMGFGGTGIGRLIKIATNDWILTGNNIWWD